MPAVFESDLYCVLALYPSQIIGELPTVIRLETELTPAVGTQRVVFGVVISGKINQRRTGILRHKAAVARGVEIWNRFSLSCGSAP